ncbi:MAG TPA: MCE family protein [Nocardioidaceae bacterium]|nr:MCE family protein [Nocardioidaceae bacterium]
MTPFRERNPAIIGAVSLAVIAVLMMAAFRAEDLPLIGGGDTYYAAFEEAGGLKANDEVRIAGVRVGQVREITLDGNRVLVEFQVDRGAEFGSQTEIDIRVKTLLGSMYLDVNPAGSGQLDAESTIPVARTTAPYDVVEAFSGLADTTERIDTGRLSDSLDTMAALMKDTPEEVRASLRGLSRLSKTVASRDAELNTLLQNAEKVTRVLANRDQELSKLFADGQLLFRAVYERREAIHRLLVTTQTLSQEISTLVAETRADLKPALRQLDSVLDVLRKNQENLDNSLRLMAPFYRVFANTLGNGPWFDTFIQNFPPAPNLEGTLRQGLPNLSGPSGQGR